MKRLLALLLISLFSAGAACTKVESDQVGVRVLNVPLINRVEKTPKLTGYHFYLPYLFTFYKLPQTHMIIEMSERGKIEFKPANEAIEAIKMVGEQEKAPELPQEQMNQVKGEMRKEAPVQIVVHNQRTGNQSVRVKTADGNDAWVDVTATYRVIPEKASLVIQKLGGSEREIRPAVAAMIRGTTRSWLGELDSKAILRAMDRKVQVEQGAAGELQEKLEELGISLVKLSAPSVSIHPDYETVLSQKRIAEEEKEEYIAYQQKAVQQKQTKVNKAKGEADSMIELAKGRFQKTVQEADALLAAKEMEAEATATKYNQRAEAVTALTRALSGPGGAEQVGLAVSKAVQGKKIVIVPGQGAFNMLDLNELIQTYGAAKAIKSGGDRQGTGQSE